MRKLATKMIDLENKKVIVIGLARTGYAVAKRCRELGARVWVTEMGERLGRAEESRSLEALGVEVDFGPHDIGILEGADLVIPSPGIPPSTAIIKEAKKRGLPVISEIELSSRLTTQPIIGVTGTNGKTTTTALVVDILRAAGIKSEACGNIGRPMVEFLTSDNSVTLVVELSSFQLEFVDQFRPDVGVLLNITPDHLNWHEGFEAYTDAKLKMFARQTSSDWAIANESCLRLIDFGQARKLIFGRSPGVFIKDQWIVHDLKGGLRRILKLGDLPLRGAHNLANAMAATAVALTQEVTEEVIATALRDFKGVEHRLDLILQISGILFYNDSKATNPEATIGAIGSFSEEIILLAGGRNKGNDFDQLALEAKGRVKSAILFGESASEMTDSFEKHSIQTKKVNSLEEAVRLGIKLAKVGDVVLLSPACASQDMFSDYQERGHCFENAVKAEVGLNGKS